VASLRTEVCPFDRAPFDRHLASVNFALLTAIDFVTAQSQHRHLPAAPAVLPTAPAVVSSPPAEALRAFAGAVAHSASEGFAFL
jgi:hypothetical protein